jgi:RND family efflux transporter MFP subunit
VNRLQSGRILRTATLLLAALLLTAGCGGAQETTPDVAAEAPASAAEAPVTTQVEVERVRSARLTALVVASGTVEARRLTAVASEVPGRIVEVLVEVGDEVEVNAPLFRIDSQPYRTALAEARAGLALSIAESNNAAQEAQRMGLLVKQNVASQQRYDQLRTQAAVAAARVSQMSAQVTRAQRDVNRAVARAPYAGSVVERRSHEGAMASAGTPVVVLQESSALEAILDVPEATPIPIRSGDPVTLYVEGLADPLETQVSRVSHRVDPQTRTYEVRAELEQPGSDLKAAPEPPPGRSSTIAPC